MKTIIMSALTVVGLFSFMSAPALAQDNGERTKDCCAGNTASCCNRAGEDPCTWTMVYDGKHTFQKHLCADDQKQVKPGTTRIEVRPEDRQAGDVEGSKYVGKRMERAYFRDVPVTTETAKGHVCSWRTMYEKKQVVKVDICLVDGVEHTCLGMNHAGECLGMK